MYNLPCPTPSPTLPCPALSSPTPLPHAQAGISDTLRNLLATSSLLATSTVSPGNVLRSAEQVWVGCVLVGRQPTVHLARPVGCREASSE